MAQKTAMQTLIAWGDEMLQKHPQKILSFAEAIDKAEELLEMEKEQLNLARMEGVNLANKGYGKKPDNKFDPDFMRKWITNNSGRLTQENK